MGFFIFHTSLRVCKLCELLPAFYSSFSVLVFPAAFTVRRRLSPGPAEVRGNQQRSAALETFRNSHRRSAAFAVPHACLLHSVLLLRASSTSNCSGLFTTVLISRRRFQISQRFQGYSLAALTLRDSSRLPSSLPRADRHYPWLFRSLRRSLLHRAL